MTIGAADNGFGLRSESIADGGTVVYDPHLNCSGIASSRCPAADSWAVAPPYVEGEHTLQVAAADAIGQTSAWTTTTKVDGTAPSASVTISQTATLNAKVETSEGSAANARSGVKKVEVFLDEKLEKTELNSCSASGCLYNLNFTWSRSFGGLAAGEHKIKITAYDQFEHATSASAAFKVVPLDTAIDSGPAGVTKEATPKFTYQSTQEGSTFQCRVDTGAWVSCATSGYTTAKLGEGPIKIGQLLPAAANMSGALSTLRLDDAFATTESPLSEAGTWAALSWDYASANRTGHVVAAEGWGPSDPWESGEAINGAYWTKATFADTGAGDAVAATLKVRPGLAARHFELLLNMPTPVTARNGYELRFTEPTGGTGTYTVTLVKSVSGTATTLATQTGVSLAVGGRFGLADKAGVLSVWTAPATGEFTQLLTAGDSTYQSGYVGIAGGGNFARLANFRGAQLPPF